MIKENDVTEGDLVIKGNHVTEEGGLNHYIPFNLQLGIHLQLALQLVMNKLHNQAVFILHLMHEEVREEEK